MSNLIKLLDDASEMACGPARQHIPDTLYHMAAREIERLTQQLEEAKRDAERYRVIFGDDLAYMKEPLINAKTGETIKGKVRWTIWWTGPDTSLVRKAIDLAVKEPK